MFIIRFVKEEAARHSRASVNTPHFYFMQYLQQNDSVIGRLVLFPHKKKIQRK